MNTPTYPSNSTFPAASSTGHPIGAPTAAASPPLVNQAELEAKAEELRNRLGHTFKQLGKRWKKMFNIRAQLRSHPVATVLTGTAVALVIGGGVTLQVAQHYRRKDLVYRVKKEFKRATKRLWAQFR